MAITLDGRVQRSPILMSGLFILVVSSNWECWVGDISQGQNRITVCQHSSTGLQTTHHPDSARLSLTRQMPCLFGILANTKYFYHLIHLCSIKGSFERHNSLQFQRMINSFSFSFCRTNDLNWLKGPLKRVWFLSFYYSETLTLTLEFWLNVHIVTQLALNMRNKNLTSQQLLNSINSLFCHLHSDLSAEGAGWVGQKSLRVFVISSNKLVACVRYWGSWPGSAHTGSPTFLSEIK